jgi:hypothetical protein
VVPEQLVPIRSRKREFAQVMQKLQHVVPAAPLLFQGVTRLRHEPHGWSLLLALAEVGISVLVIGTFGRQLRSMRNRPEDDHDHHAAHGVDWIDVAIGVMLGIEVWAHWYETGHVKRPTVLMATGIFIIGLLHGRIAARAGRRLALKIDDVGVAIGGRPFRNFRAAWHELADVVIEPQQARLVRRDGKARAIDFRDLRNAADVRAALEGVRLRLLPPPEAEAGTGSGASAAAGAAPDPIAPA